LESIFKDCVREQKDKKILGFIMNLHGYISSHPEIRTKLKTLISSRDSILKDFLKQKIKEGRLAEDMFNIALHIICANTIYAMHSAAENHIKFSDNYPKQMAQAVLRAICHKGES
jgi:hypothetical protein